MLNTLPPLLIKETPMGRKYWFKAEPWSH